MTGVDVVDSDLGLGQTQDDSIVGLRQTKQTPPTTTITGSLSSSNPDLAQGQQRIIDYSVQPPGKRQPVSGYSTGCRKTAPAGSLPASLFFAVLTILCGLEMAC